MNTILSSYQITIPAKFIRFPTRMVLLLPMIFGLTLVAVLSTLLSTPVQAAPTAIIALDIDTSLDSNGAAFQVCTSDPADCSLRGAISRANADTTNEYIITIPEGMFAFSLAGSREDNNATGDLDLSGNITLSGAGAISTTINANQRDRGLHIFSGAVVTLENLTLTNGKAPDGADGDAGATGGVGGSGGGIFNSGTLTLTQVILNANATGSGGEGGDGAGGFSPICFSGGPGGPGGPGGSGGGIFNVGTLTISKSTFSGNTTGIGGFGGIGGMCPMTGLQGNAGAGGDGGAGGGIYNAAGSNLLIHESTLNGNQTGDGSSSHDNGNSSVGGNAGNGAGIYNQGALTITNSTLSSNSTGNGGRGYWNDLQFGGLGGDGGQGGGVYNTATISMRFLTINGNRTGTGGAGGDGDPDGTDGLGGGFYQASGALEFLNSVIAGNDSLVNTSDDCYGTPTSLGYNLVGSSTGCPTNGTGDRATSNAILGPLGDNGGDTPTHALLAGSPAIDQIPAGGNGCVANTSTDQRNAVRAGGVDRGGDLCDIGAYEAASLWTPNAITLPEFSTRSSNLLPLILLGGLGIIILTTWGTRRFLKIPVRNRSN